MIYVGTDIVPILKGFKLQNGTDGLTVMNPPTIRLDNTAVEEQDLENLTTEKEEQESEEPKDQELAEISTEDLIEKLNEEI